MALRADALRASEEAAAEERERAWRAEVAAKRAQLQASGVLPAPGPQQRKSAVELRGKVWNAPSGCTWQKCLPSQALIATPV